MIDMTLNTLEELKNVEMWFFNLDIPKEINGISIYVYENQQSYFYSFREEFGKRRLVTE